MDLSGKNHFLLFSLAESYQLDLELLTKNYHLLQQQVHPDKFANGSARERLLAVQYTSIVNEAFETLKSPLKRAAYLLSLRGMDVEKVDQADLTPAFLMQQIELREQLAQLLELKTDEALNNLDKLMSQVQTELHSLQSEFAANYTNKAFSQAKPVYNKMQFLHKLAVEIEAAEEKILA